MRLAVQVIISGLSSPDVLTLDGAINYARAIGLCVLILRSSVV